MWQTQLLLLVASYLLSSALAPKAPKPKPAAFGDFDFPQAEEGTPQPVVFGDVWIEAWTVIGLDNYRSRAIKTRSSKK